MKEIPVSNGKLCLVDDIDFNFLLSLSPWHDNGNGYVYCISYGDHLYMHRLVSGIKPGCDVDHIDGNTYDNRASNLRIATRSQNSANSKPRQRTGPFPGVYQETRTKKGGWRSQIRENGKQIYLGTYSTPEEAYEVYKKAHKRIYGDFSNQ